MFCQRYSKRLVFSFSRYDDEEDERGYSALDHIRYFSDARKMEESEMSEGDGEEDAGSFSSPTLAKAVKQPLYRKSKTQVLCVCLSVCLSSKK